MQGLAKRLSHLLTASLLAGMLAGCGSAMDDVTDSDLQSQAKDCKRTLDKGPAMAIQCDNVEAECKRRRKQGRFVC